jgi:hypothetical protein
MSAEIEAAHIAAQATIRAALYQGGLTIVAGLVAIVGGWLAYRGAVKGAERQVQLDEQRDAARIAAYRFRIEAVARELDARALLQFSAAVAHLKRFREHGGSWSIPLLPLPPFPELSDRHWEDHALLGRRALPALRQVQTSLNEYELFRSEVFGRDLKCDDSPEHSSFIEDVEAERSDAILIPVANVVERNEILARALVNATNKLLSAILAKPPP